MREDKINVLTPGEGTAERTTNISLIDYQRKDIEYFDIIADPNKNVIETNEQNNNLQL
jgi:hypothetical protein